MATSSTPLSEPEATTSSISMTPGSTNNLVDQTEALLLNIEMDSRQAPIIYSPNYNIKFYGFERCHPFDVSKWKHIYDDLLEDETLFHAQSVCPPPVTDEILRFGHTTAYLDSLNNTNEVANIAEVCFLRFVPNSVIQKRLLTPLKYQVGGSLLGLKLAKERGWAINLGGGFHHCTRNAGSGFCFYADISLCVRYVIEADENAKVMIIDLDAHQGNGHERDWRTLKDKVFILDVFNSRIFPQDDLARRRIDCPVPLDFYTKDDEYLDKVQKAVTDSLQKFLPTFVIYNAGTDILQGDPLGRLSITADGIIQRDFLVFKECKDRGIPILMLTSGGYQKKTARIIGNSIRNLISNSIIFV